MTSMAPQPAQLSRAGQPAQLSAAAVSGPEWSLQRQLKKHRRVGCLRAGHSAVVAVAAVVVVVVVVVLPLLAQAVIPIVVTAMAASIQGIDFFI